MSTSFTCLFPALHKIIFRHRKSRMSEFSDIRSVCRKRSPQGGLFLVKQGKYGIISTGKEAKRYAHELFDEINKDRETHLKECALRPYWLLYRYRHYQSETLCKKTRAACVLKFINAVNRASSKGRIVF